MSPNPPSPIRAAVDGRRLDAPDRAVSEVVSFILTFSIITMMIGILYTAGAVSMEQLQTGNQMQNAEGVFFAMADSFGELQEGQAPKRAGSLDLDVGASVGVSNDSEVAVQVHDDSGVAFSRTLAVSSLDYRLDERAVTYETGAVFRSNEGNSAMVREPGGIFCSPGADSAMVSLVTLVDPEGAGVASGTATITGLQRSTTLLFPTDRNASESITNVTIDVTSPHAPAWDRHLVDATGWEDPDDDGTFVCEDVDQVFVRHTIVEVRTDA